MTYKHCFVCDKCKKEHNTFIDTYGTRYPANWINIYGKDFCNKCKKDINPLMKEFLNKVNKMIK